MDISVFMQGGLDPDESNRELDAELFTHKVKALQNTFSALENARQPVLAAIQGGAIGAGVDLVTACDCRYASEDAFFCIQETAVGMTADVGTFPRLARLIPEGWARFCIASWAWAVDATATNARGQSQMCLSRCHATLSAPSR